MTQKQALAKLRKLAGKHDFFSVDKCMYGDKRITYTMYVNIGVGEGVMAYQMESMEACLIDIEKQLKERNELPNT
ncbi:MAG TPA: hypothetical protein PLE74_00960 [Candidatus Cloacimonadota bacterium]|nr:hypothetical protein [Candidatus Cloacimonadota bacterium]